LAPVPYIRFVIAAAVGMIFFGETPRADCAASVMGSASGATIIRYQSELARSLPQSSDLSEQLPGSRPFRRMRFAFVTRLSGNFAFICVKSVYNFR